MAYHQLQKNIASKVNILVCGGGHGAHTLAIMAASRRNVDVKVLTRYENEAIKWSKALQEGEMTASLVQEEVVIRSRPTLVTDQPAEVVTEADVIFIVAPAYQHARILRAIYKHIQLNSIIVGFPGHPGFEMECLNILGKTAKYCVMLSFETLPWACRLTSYGKAVEILGTKDTIGVFMWKGNDSKCRLPVVKTIQSIIGDKPKMKCVENYIVLNLMVKSILHPPILYGRWKDWDGRALDHKPLLYHGVDDVQAALVANVSNEIIEIAQALKHRFPEIDISQVTHVYEWLKSYYSDQVDDCSSLERAMQTNRAYKGLTHPMKRVKEGGYIPDFSYRYITQDVPFGLVVLKGIAQIFGVETRTMDDIIKWGQCHLEKEYIVGTELKGKDLEYTRAPQSFGIHTVNGLMKLESIW